jgi:hypothetical protein
MPGDDAQVHHEWAASSQPPRVRAELVAPPVTAASAKRATGRKTARAETRRVTARRVVVAIALIAIMASAALLIYFVRNRQFAADLRAPVPLEAAPGTNESTQRDSASTANEPSASEPAGIVKVSLPIRVELYENGHLLGTNDRDGVRLTTGAHQIEIVNKSLHYHASKRVAVSAGRTTTVPVALPVSTLQLNATPWAQVTIDGNRVGETPLELNVRIGQHNIVFQNPGLRAQTRSVLVTTVSPTRVTVDLRK